MKNKDPLKTKANPLTYFLCLFLAFISTITTFALWLFTSLKIALASGYTTSYLESEQFIKKHSDEHLTITICNFIQEFLKSHFVLIFIGLMVVCILLIVALWFSSKRNSYIFVKFQAAITATSGILMILLPALLLILGLSRSVKLVNAQNTALFSAFIKSTCFIIIAIGVILLAVAFMEEFLAATIAKNRKSIYERMMKKTHVDM
ncbi:MAG: hypothetical protein E7388_06145 [Ruminococcaceae bacterium]|nr:hypothetical protein [Oscillospiraceae bacterium]